MKQNYLRRYTDLPSLLHILETKKITLLNPGTWDDKNDSYYIKIYKERRQLAAVLALCFTQEPETYHHWKVFAGTGSGVCIEFDKPALVRSLKADHGVFSRAVVYRKIREQRGKDWKVNDLPFVKRFPFRDEKEFRFVYEDKQTEVATKDFAFPISCIRKIIVNPWMPRSVYTSVKQIIQRIDGCEAIKVTVTTLVNNEEWKTMGEKATG